MSAPLRIRSGVESGPLGHRPVVRIDLPDGEVHWTRGVWTQSEADAEDKAATFARKSRAVFAESGIEVLTGPDAPP